MTNFFATLGVSTCYELGVLSKITEYYYYNLSFNNNTQFYYSSSNRDSNCRVRCIDAALGAGGEEDDPAIIWRDIDAIISRTARFSSIHAYQR